MAESQKPRQRRTRDTKETRPSPLAGHSEASFEALVKEERAKPEHEQSRVVMRLAEQYERDKERDS